MFDFCPHCGQTPGGLDQVVGKMLVCQYCGKDIGIVVEAPAKVMVDRAAEILQGGTAARCPVCGQLVEIKISGGVRSLVPHAGQSEKRRMCPGGSKPVVAPNIENGGSKVEYRESKIEDRKTESVSPAALPTDRKDLSAFMNREVIRVVACRRGAEPTIEELRLEYLDMADRVRLQIEALRDILGKSFQMRSYPPALRRPQFAVWSNADVCVIAKRHERGGYQVMIQDELRQVLDEIRGQRALFFA